MTKLHGWFDKVAGRDRLGATGRDAAANALSDCATAMEGLRVRGISEKISISREAIIV
jgi:hypothetical protein